MSDFIRFLDKLQCSQYARDNGLLEAIRAGYRAITESEDAAPANWMDELDMDIADSSFTSNDGTIDAYFCGGPFDTCGVDYNFNFHFSTDITRTYNPGTNVEYGSTMVQYEPEGYDIGYENESIELDDIADANGNLVSTEDCAASLGITVDELNGIIEKFKPRLISYAEENLDAPPDDDDGPDWDGDW